MVPDARGADYWARHPYLGGQRDGRRRGETAGTWDPIKTLKKKGKLARTI